MSCRPLYIPNLNCSCVDVKSNINRSPNNTLEPLWIVEEGIFSYTYENRSGSKYRDMNPTSDQSWLGISATGSGRSKYLGEYQLHCGVPTNYIMAWLILPQAESLAHVLALCKRQSSYEDVRDDH